MLHSQYSKNSNCKEIFYVKYGVIFMKISRNKIISNNVTKKKLQQLERKNNAYEFYIFLHKKNVIKRQKSITRKNFHFHKNN